MSKNLSVATCAIIAVALIQAGSKAGPNDAYIATQDTASWHRSDWDLRLCLARIDAEGCLDISATLTNMSVKTANIDISEVTRRLALGTRIWQRGLDGSFRLQNRTGLHTFSLEPPMKIIQVNPKEQLDLAYRCDRVDFGKGPYSVYEWAFHILHERRGPVKNPTNRLAAGEYVVDCTLDLDILSNDQRASSASKSVALTVCSGNKLWTRVLE